MVRVILPAHLRTLAHSSSELRLEVPPPVTVAAVLDALEACYPMLRGTVRDHDSKQRRAYVRFYAGEEDLSLEPPHTLLPEAVASGHEPFTILGAIAGGT